MIGKCRGCRIETGPVCPACTALAEGRVEARRALWPPVLALVAAGGWAAAWMGLWVDALHHSRSTGIQILEVALLGAAVLFAWGLRSLASPHLYVLVGDGLEIRRALGRTVRGHIVEFTDDKGVLVHELGNRRYEVGSCRFNGAERFHRALRVRQSLLRP